MNQLNTLFFVVVCGFFALAAAEKCSGEGFQVVEGDCSKYYRCVNGERVNFECSDGLKFHTKLETCVWGNELECVAVPRPSTEATPTTPKAPSAPTADCPKGDGHFVDDKNCNRFYVCLDGARNYNNCPSSLEFDTVSKTCMEAGKAKCSNE